MKSMKNLYPPLSGVNELVNKVGVELRRIHSPFEAIHRAASVSDALRPLSSIMLLTDVLTEWWSKQPERRKYRG